MTASLLLIACAVIMLIVGVFIGKKIARLQQVNAQQNSRHEIASLESTIAHLKTKTTEQQQQHDVYYAQMKEDYRKRLEQLKQERDDFRTAKEQLSNHLAQRNTAYANLEENYHAQQAEIEKLELRFQKEFENLATKILERNSEKFTALNKSRMESILNPLAQKIKGFEEKVDKNRESSIKQHAELGKQLEQLNSQNLKISEEATNLTRALKGNTKMQGDWGEVILERVLEQSGLRKDSEYFTQQSFVNAQHRRVRPDVIIALPNNRKMIIDSKVSLGAYERYSNSTTTEQQQQQLKLHLNAIKKHVSELSQRKYHQLYSVESPDFVLLFIPIEAAFAVASQAYPQLYSDAYDQNIIIVTPTTLLAVLKTIDSTWQQERQRQNAVDIASQAGRLYDTFVNLITEFEKVGKQLQSAQNSYDSAMKKLTGRQSLIRRVEKLKTLGAKASKQIDSDLLS